MRERPEHLHFSFFPSMALDAKKKRHGVFVCAWNQEKGLFPGWIRMALGGPSDWVRLAFPNLQVKNVSFLFLLVEPKWAVQGHNNSKTKVQLDVQERNSNLKVLMIHRDHILGKSSLCFSV